MAADDSTTYDDSLGRPRYRLLAARDPAWPADDPLAGLPTFEIGLVLAGAISAGAYVGGVLDFLFQALDAFDAAKRQQYADHGTDYAKWTVPAHNVRIKVVSGASAGGMTAAIMAAAARYRFPHIDCDAAAVASGADNPFYNAWVRQIDMKDFLGDRDLKDPVLHSLLDCSKLDEIVVSALTLDTTKPVVDRPWLGNPLKLVMTVTNLRGIPYQFPMPGTIGGYYSSTQHADVLRFSLSPDGADSAKPDEFNLRWGNDPQNWQALGTAALATGSFPVALRSRTLHPKPAAYNASWMTIAVPADPDDEKPAYYKMSLTPLTPAWGGSSQPYSFASADGGIINNVPLEHARIELAGLEGRNPRDAQKAMRAIILIDPLPEPPQRDVHADADAEGVFALIGGAIDAMKNQSRFHPEDIALACRDDVYSRFILNPNRSDETRGRLFGGLALSCGGLGGFSGFLHESFRHHDFLLGRLNCAAFLRNEFSLQVKTGAMPDLFRCHPDLSDAQFSVTRDDGGTERVILPLVGDLNLAEHSDNSAGLIWPRDRFYPEELRTRIEGRMSGLTKKAIAGVKNGVLRTLLGFAWSSSLVGSPLKREVSNILIARLRQDLVTHDLISRT